MPEKFSMDPTLAKQSPDRHVASPPPLERQDLEGSAKDGVNAPILPRETPDRQLLRADFFDRAPDVVARDLIGATLLYKGAGGAIVETEAYHPDDPASHSFKGQTLRNAAMYGMPGTAYVYRIYGMHWCLNVVCKPGNAVLIRAIQPEIGVQEMTDRRSGLALRLLASGPGRLCSALGISNADDGTSLLAPPFAMTANPEPREIAVGPRIGITKGVAEPLRFGLLGSPFLSKTFGMSV